MQGCAHSEEGRMCNCEKEIRAQAKLKFSDNCMQVSCLLTNTDLKCPPAGEVSTGRRQPIIAKRQRDRGKVRVIQVKESP